jgi:hypothetical protein
MKNGFGLITNRIKIVGPVVFTALCSFQTVYRRCALLGLKNGQGVIAMEIMGSKCVDRRIFQTATLVLR